MSILGQRIQQRRKDFGMSQMEFAEKLDTAQAQVSRYETGQNDPTSEVIIRMAQILRVRVEWLLGLTDIMVMPAESEQGLTSVERQIVEVLRMADPLKQQELAEVFARIV